MRSYSWTGVLFAFWVVSLEAIAAEPAVSRAELLTQTLESRITVDHIVSQRIEMAPAVAGQKHFHPVPVVGYVVAGEIAFQIEGEELQILKAGDAFFEPANARVVRWENVGSVRAVFVANYIATADTQELLIRIE